MRGKDPGGGVPGTRRACDDGKQEDDAHGKRCGLSLTWGNSHSDGQRTLAHCRGRCAVLPLQPGSKESRVTNTRTAPNMQTGH